MKDYNWYQSEPTQWAVHWLKQIWLPVRRCVDVVFARRCRSVTVCGRDRWCVESVISCCSTHKGLGFFVCNFLQTKPAFLLFSLSPGDPKLRQHTALLKYSFCSPNHRVMTFINPINPLFNWLISSLTRHNNLSLSCFCICATGGLLSRINPVIHSTSSTIKQRVCVN